MVPGILTLRMRQSDLDQPCGRLPRSGHGLTPSLPSSDDAGDGRLIVAHKVTRISRTAFRYDYAVYNMNNDRGVRSFSVPTGSAQISNIGFGSGFSHGENWSNEPWQGAAANGQVTWSTKTFQQDENANAIRWGTTYNFWFETEAPPTLADVAIARFKPGPTPESVSVKVQGPKI